MSVPADIQTRNGPLCVGCERSVIFLGAAFDYYNKNSSHFVF